MDPIARLTAQRAAKEATTNPADVATPSPPTAAARMVAVEPIPDQSTATATTAPDVQQQANATVDAAITAPDIQQQADATVATAPTAPDMQQPATATIDVPAAVPAVLYLSTTITYVIYLRLLPPLHLQSFAQYLPYCLGLGPVQNSTR